MRSLSAVFLLCVASLGCRQLQGEGDIGKEVVVPVNPDPCARRPAPADRERLVITSHPFETGPQPVNRAQTYAVWRLSAAGELAPTAERLTMGRAADGQDMVFTPDGEVGIVVQDGGSLGVFRVGPEGVEVVHRAFTAGFEASHVVMHPSGERVFVLDTRFGEDGGGIYEVRIDCDGSLQASGRIAASKLPAGMVLMPGDPSRAVLAARGIGGSMAGDDVHLLDLSPRAAARLAVLGGADVFGDDEAAVAGMAVTLDGRYALIGDNGLFNQHRVAVARVDAAGLTAEQLLVPLEDPVAILASPYNNAAIVVSGYGDAIFHLRYDPHRAGTKVREAGQITYASPAPRLPKAAVMIERGDLTGLVLVAENQGVRRVYFEASGEVTDLGVVTSGEGPESIIGTIGVQP